MVAARANATPAADLMNASTSPTRGLIGAAAELRVETGECRSLDWRECQRVGYTRKCEELLHERPFGKNLQR